MQSPQYINTCGNDVHISGITLCRGMGQSSEAFSRQEEVGAVSGAAFAIRSELFETLCGFDESFFMYMEDTDLSLRARLLGYRCVCVPDSIVYHRYTLRFGPRKTFYQERNRYLMILKCLRRPTLLLLFPVLLIAELVTWGFVLLREPQNWRNKWDAYTWIISHWGEIQAKHRNVQFHRRVSDHEILVSCKDALDFHQVGEGRVAMVAQLVLNPLFAFLNFLVKRMV
jgi:GT2 family glycosyltransferase